MLELMSVPLSKEVVHFTVQCVIYIITSKRGLHIPCHRTTVTHLLTKLTEAIQNRFDGPPNTIGRFVSALVDVA